MGYGFWFMGKSCLYLMIIFLGSWNQSVESITRVEELSPGHFYRPDIEVDVTEEIIENPEKIFY